MNIANLLTRAGRSAGDRPAVVVGRTMIRTYKALSDRAATLATALRRRFSGRPGDRVAIVMRNCAAYPEVLFGCWHAGMVAVPVNAKLHPREIEFVLAHAGAGTVFVGDDLAEPMAAVAGSVSTLRNIVVVGGRDYERLFQGPPLPIEPRAPEDLAWLFYTSGTTGRPKGAMLSHRNLLAMTVTYFADVDDIGAGGGILHAAPMSHGSGMYSLPHTAAAAAHILPESGGFDAAEIYDLLGTHRGVSLFAAPTMVRRLLDCPAAGGDLTGLKTIVYGGGPMYVADCKRAVAVFGDRLVQIYGQGESPMTITVLSKAHHTAVDHPRYESRLASVGVPQTVVEVAVAAADDTVLPPGEAGEVLVRGETVMRGYWQDPVATADTLRGSWLHTGDVGFFDDDGFLTLKDRSKDLIISGGSNIYPREVEEVLLHHPGVSEVTVVGEPDAEWGEVVVAFVVPMAGTSLAPEALDAVCLDHLARFKRPKRYLFVDALPKNNYGKVLKTELRQRLDPSKGRAP
jgi:long-chain acyl-CoA synthetase